jgi:hypothetical protein
MKYLIADIGLMENYFVLVINHLMKKRVNKFKMVFKVKYENS